MKKNITRIPLFVIVINLVLTSCANRNLVYFSNLPQNSPYNTNTISITEPKIQPGDLLSIKVSSLSTESNAIFNAGGAVVGGEGNNETGYLVDKTGTITFPIIGKIKLGGLTNEQAREKMTTEVVRYVKDPIVNLRLINFRVTVIGEVSRPNTFNVANEKINLLEALGMAGDMTAFGRRENVLLIREKDGQKTMARLNLNDKDIINSPYFHLQQNDVVYVEPVPARAAQANNSGRFLSIIVGLTSVATLVISRLL